MTNDDIKQAYEKADGPELHPAHETDTGATGADVAVMGCAMLFLFVFVALVLR